MAIKALDIAKTRDFTSKYDTDGDPTIWKIGTLTSRDIGAIRDSVTSFSFHTGNGEGGGGEGEAGQEMDTRIERSKMQFEAVRRGLRGWENFLHPQTGQPIDFRTIKRDLGGGVRIAVVPNELLDLIPSKVVEELSEQIMGDNEPEEGEAKNSQEPSTGGSSTPTGTADPVH